MTDDFSIQFDLMYEHVMDIVLTVTLCTVLRTISFANPLFTHKTVYYCRSYDYQNNRSARVEKLQVSRRGSCCFSAWSKQRGAQEIKIQRTRACAPKISSRYRPRYRGRYLRFAPFSIESALSCGVKQTATHIVDLRPLRRLYFPWIRTLFSCLLLLFLVNLFSNDLK